MGALSVCVRRVMHPVWILDAEFWAQAAEFMLRTAPGAHQSSARIEGGGLRCDSRPDSLPALPPRAQGAGPSSRTRSHLSDLDVCHRVCGSCACYRAVAAGAAGGSLARMVASTSRVLMTSLTRLVLDGLAWLPRACAAGGAGGGEDTLVYGRVGRPCPST